MLPRPAVFQRAVRCFSSTRPTHGYTSHIGKTPIPIPPSVILNTTPTKLEVTGPLGSTSVPLEQYMHLTPATNGVVALSVDDAIQKKQRSMWGLTRTLINNAVIGMTEGFSVPLYLVGVGYRAALEDDPRGTENGGNGKRLNMKLGFSHSVFVPIPPHIKAGVPTATKIVLSCTDKHQLGLFAAKVRKWRPPEPYKGKVRFLRLGRVVRSHLRAGDLRWKRADSDQSRQEEVDPINYPPPLLLSFIDGTGFKCLLRPIPYPIQGWSTTIPPSLCVHFCVRLNCRPSSYPTVPRTHGTTITLPHGLQVVRECRLTQ